MRRHEPHEAARRRPVLLPLDRRRTVNGIPIWVLRTGSPWRDLPERYGP